MTVERFEALALPLGLGALIVFMFFIIYDLGRQSEAGKWGMTVLFIVLGLGVFGFIAKEFILEWLMHR